MGRSRYIITDDQAPYFLTCTVINWFPLFSKPAIVELVLNSLQHLQTSGRLRLYAYVIMENHLHLIASSENLSRELASFKSYTAREIIDHLNLSKSSGILRQLHFYRRRHKADRIHQVWQEGSHPELIQGVDMMRQKTVYIHMNPVRRGYVDEAEDWRYSSACIYAGRPGILKVMTEWS